MYRSNSHLESGPDHELFIVNTSSANNASVTANSRVECRKAGFGAFLLLRYHRAHEYLHPTNTNKRHFATQKHSEDPIRRTLHWRIACSSFATRFSATEEAIFCESARICSTCRPSFVRTCSTCSAPGFVPSLSAGEAIFCSPWLFVVASWSS